LFVPGESGEVGAGLAFGQVAGGVEAVRSAFVLGAAKIIGDYCSGCKPNIPNFQRTRWNALQIKWLYGWPPILQDAEHGKLVGWAEPSEAQHSRPLHIHTWLETPLGCPIGSS
jgi:hypothetical protein